MGKSSTTFAAKWAAGKTKVIRVPVSLADRVLEYARELDAKSGEGTGVADPPSAYAIAAPPRPIDRKRPINVASIPLRSPFRYPGGKTWLVPYLRRWLNARPEKPALFLEPFAGGGICSLTVAFENLARHVLMVELDENVAAVWETILLNRAEWLANRILTFELTIGNVQQTLEKANGGNHLPLKDRAFLTLLRNRVQRGGIMARGAGLIKSGENGRGIGSRWYPQTLARRIREIGLMRHRISFARADGMKTMREHLCDPETVVFADPPYTRAARRLYSHWQFDHRRLFEMLSSAAADFLISYDDTDEIRDLASEFGMQAREVCMKNTHNARKTELLIGRDLSWLESLTSGPSLGLL